MPYLPELLFEQQSQIFVSYNQSLESINHFRLSI